MALVEMKRLCAIAPQSSRRQLLRALCRMGCVEVESSEQLPDSTLLRHEENTGAQLFKTQIEGARNILQRLAPAKKSMLTPKREISEGALFEEKTLDRAVAAANAINALSAKIEAAKAEIIRAETRIAGLKPWKSMSLPLNYSGSPHTVFVCGALPQAVALETVADNMEKIGVAAEITEISSDNDWHYISCFIFKQDEEAAINILKGFGFGRESFHGLSDAAEDIIILEHQTIEGMKQDILNFTEKIKSYAAAREDIDLSLDAYAQEAERDVLLSKVGFTEKTVVFYGWTPTEQMENVSKVLEQHGCAYEYSDPAEGESPPTAMRNGKIAAPFAAVTDMYGMPAYGSIVDPNPLMVPFYVTFFGFIMGDAAYGILIFLGCFLGLKIMKPKGTMKQMLTMFMYCGVSTFIAGVLTGGWFADAIFVFSDAFLGKGVSIPPLWFDPLKEPMTMLIFSMVLGVIQIFTGMAISAYRQIKQGDIFGAIIDQGSWYLIFIGIGVAVLGSSIGTIMAIAGVAMLLLFAGRGKKGFGRITGGLGALYNVTGYVSDLLSYSRIMALGLSGAVVGQVVNKMGAMGGGSLWGIPLFLLVFVIGHTFNIAISVLGAYVHTSRLQYIEFFGRFYEGGGRPFKPLRNTTKYVDII